MFYEILDSVKLDFGGPSRGETDDRFSTRYGKGAGGGGWYLKTSSVTASPLQHPYLCVGLYAGKCVGGIAQVLGFQSRFRCSIADHRARGSIRSPSAFYIQESLGAYPNVLY